MKIKKIFCAGIFLFAMSMIASCENVGQSDQTIEEPVDSYRMEKEVVVDIDESVLTGCYVSEPYIFYSQTRSGGTGGIWMRELVQEAEPSCVCSFAENEILQAFTVTGARNVIAAVRDREQGSVKLRKTDKNGEVIWESEFPERKEGLFISRLLEGSDGRIYAASSQEIFLWSMSGKYERCLQVRGELIQQLADIGDGKVAVLQRRQKEQTLTVYQGTDGKKVLQKDFGSERQWFNEGLFYPADSLLAQYHWDRNSSEAILDFTECGIAVSNIRLFGP